MHMVAQHVHMADDSTDATTDAVEAFESEPIIRVFGNPACVRIMVALIDAGPDQDFAAGEIVELAHIGRRTWYANRDLLLEMGLVEQTRESGNSTMYRANWGSEPVKAFVHLYDALGQWVGEQHQENGDGEE